MKILLSAVVLLMLLNAAVAQNATNQTTPFPGSGTLKSIYNLLVTANPVVLLILGGVLLIVSKFAKWIGIILIIIAIIHFFFWFVG